MRAKIQLENKERAQKWAMAGLIVVMAVIDAIISAALSSGKSKHGGNFPKSY